MTIDIQNRVLESLNTHTPRYVFKTLELEDHPFEDAIGLQMTDTKTGKSYSAATTVKVDGEDTARELKRAFELQIDIIEGRR